MPCTGSDAENRAPASTAAAATVGEVRWATVTCGTNVLRPARSGSGVAKCGLGPSGSTAGSGGRSGPERSAAASPSSSTSAPRTSR